MQLDDMPGTLAVPLLVPVEHVNVHLLPGVSQGAAWGPGQMPAGVDGYEFGQTPGDSEAEGSLECCSPWGHKESDMT